MVARLVKLKWRLLINGLRHDKQRMVGFPLLMAFLTFGGFALAARYMDTAESLSGTALAEFSMWAALLLWIGWMTLPVLLFPIDETLNPAKFGLTPVTTRSLMTGLTAAGALTPPILVPILLIAANLGIFLPGGGAILALLASTSMLVLLVMSTQMFSAVVTAILRTRYGRDFIFVIIGALGFGIFTIQQRIATVTGELGLAGAVAANPLSSFSWVLPPVAAQNSIVNAADGNLVVSVGWLLVTLVWIAVVGYAWGRTVQWLMTTPEAPLRESTTSSRGLLFGNRWSTVAAIAAKELKFYFRDPRLRMVWTGGVVFLGIIGASVMLGSTQLGVLRANPAITLLAPAIVLFVGLPVALNQFGWERNAASFLFALPVRSRDLILGKNLATSVALTAEATVLSILFAALTGGWTMLAFSPFLIATAVMCQLAVGNLVSVLTPMRLPPMGTDLFAQATEQGCLALVSQMSAFGLIGLLMVPPATGFALLSAFGVNAVRYRVGFTLGSVVWGLLLYSVGLWLATRILRRRLPEMVTAVQTI